MINSDTYYQYLQKKYTRKINLDRKRIFAALEKLGKIHLNLNNVCNIIGSDGKFTTGFNLASFLKAGQKKVTFFSSPHLVSVCERITLNNRPINLNKIKKYERIVSKINQELTLFEAITLIYLLAANDQKNTSYNLVEAGAGFEKDSTNLWDHPKAQIITNINLQHQDLFKVKTLKKVIKIKVGHLSKNTTIYIGKQKPEVLKVIKKILKKNSSKKIYPSAWSIKKIREKYYYKDSKNKILIRSKNINSLGLLDNLGLAIKVALDFGIQAKIIERTIPLISYQARLQHIRKGKLRKYLNKNDILLLDGAHSDTSANNLKNYLKTFKRPIYGIWGMQKNKEPKKFISNFKKIFKKVITLKIPSEPNSCTAVELKKILINKGYSDVIASSSLENCFKKIRNNEKKIIVIFGSLYLCAEALKKN